jgi:NTE family protein
MPNARPHTKPRIALVLGGGGLKGFAHIGVLRALEERGIAPAVVAGSSIGALIGAAYTTGMSVDELTQRAVGLRRRDLFRINHVGMLLERMRSPSVYLEEPLRTLVQSVVKRVRFDEVATPLYVNTVDVARGTQVVWGLPGHRDVFVDDAVYASCALPVFFPPGRVDGRFCIDGGTVDNLPVSLVANEADAIVAVDVGNADVTRDDAVPANGFTSISMRAATIMMHALQEVSLTQWSGPPMILVRPKVGQVGWFRFDATQDLIDAGYSAATEALRDLDKCFDWPGRIFPRRLVQLTVDRAKCNGCGLCVATAPTTMALDLQGRAFPRSEVVDWSPADGDFVRQCPTGALEAKHIDPALEAKQSDPALEKAS